jgi:hypothetical protein
MESTCTEASAAASDDVAGGTGKPPPAVAAAAADADADAAAAAGSSGNSCVAAVRVLRSSTPLQEYGEVSG